MLPDLVVPCSALTLVLLIGFGLSNWYQHRRYIAPLQYRVYRLERYIKQISTPQVAPPRYRYRTIEVEEPEDYEYS